MTEAPLPSLLELTPFNSAYQMNPHAVLDDLRSRRPAHRDAVSGSLLLTRYADVREIVNDRAMWRDPIRAEAGALMQRRFLERAPEGVPRTHISSILTLDDPDHARIRQPLAQALYARVAKFRPEVERLVDEALDALAGETAFDLMERFCVPIPIDTIARILGVDRSRLAGVQDLVRRGDPVPQPGPHGRTDRDHGGRLGGAKRLFHRTDGRAAQDAPRRPDHRHGSAAGRGRAPR